jgi:hypothetical protein
MIECDRCGFKRSKHEDYRWRTGSWTVREEGDGEEYETLCEDCYGALFK